MPATTRAQRLHNLPIDTAYFCMEYALDDVPNMYAGGLGVLAGDVVMQAAVDHLPLVGIGLAYHATRDHLALVVNDDGTPVSFEIPIASEIVRIHIWIKQIGTVPLLLLDTDVDGNTEWTRHITDALYSGDNTHRLQQEIVLGIGGVQALHVLNLHPKLYHMNEGHAALLTCEHIAHTMETTHCSFFDACTVLQKKLVFTNHTLIAAGNDHFAVQDVLEHLYTYSQRYHFPLEEYCALGVDMNGVFSVTQLAMRLAKKSSAVSHLHAKEAIKQWPDTPLVPITNGVAIDRWIAPEKAFAWPLTRTTPENLELWWNAHLQCKERLRAEVSAQTGKIIPEHALVITWARRFVEYKRPKALFWQLDRLEQIIRESPIPIHFVFAGNIHTHDQVGQGYRADIEQIAQQERFSHSISFLHDYHIRSAKILVQGSDVWLNTPQVGLEACGTSGMKAGLNGVLQCSTSDGWVDEVPLEEIGWKLDDVQLSESLYDTIEKKIIPLFCKRNHSNVPHQWIDKMIATAQLIRTQYSATRMLNDYREKLYK